MSGKETTANRRTGTSSNEPKKRVFTTQVLFFLVLFASIAYFIGSMDDESDMLLHRYAQLPSPVFKLRYFFANVFQRLAESAVPQDYRMTRSLQLFAEAAALAKFAQLDVAGMFQMREHGKQLLSCKDIHERVLASGVVSSLNEAAFCRFLDYASALTLLEKHVATQHVSIPQTTVYALSYYGAQLSSKHPESMGGVVNKSLGDVALFEATLSGLNKALESGSAGDVDIAAAWIDSESFDAAYGGQIAQALFDAGASTTHSTLCFAGRSNVAELERRINAVASASSSSSSAIAARAFAGRGTASCDAIVFPGTLVSLGNAAAVEQIDAALAANVPVYIVDAMPRQHFNHVLERTKFATDLYALALSSQSGAGVREASQWKTLVRATKATSTSLFETRSVFNVLKLN